MNDPRESIPILLSRTTARNRKIRLPPLAKPPPQPPSEAAVRGALRNRLGAAGALAAAILVFVAIFADMLASELPIACKLHGQLWLFPNVTEPLPLTSLGRERVEAEADWSIGPLVHHGPDTPSKLDGLRGPGALPGHPLGTDKDGRDLFARLVHGTRSYFVFAALAVLASLLVGGVLGGFAGIFGGAIDALLGRAIETVSAFPPLVLVLGIQAAVPRPTLGTLFAAIALTRWPEVARLVRAEVIQISARDYVMAARALGATPLRVLRRHVAPNVRGQLAVLGSVGVPAVILIEASLDFLRIGTPDEGASWGETLSEFRDAPHAWWLLFFPGLLLFATVAALNLFGEARRDAFDPRSH